MKITPVAPDPEISHSVSLSGLKPYSPAPPQEPQREPATARVRDQWEEGSIATPLQARFYYDRQTHQPVVEVRDAETHELIRESPPEKVRQMSENLQKIVLSSLDVQA